MYDDALAERSDLRLVIVAPEESDTEQTLNVGIRQLCEKHPAQVTRISQYFGQPECLTAIKDELENHGK